MVAVTVLGDDRPGIVADVTAALAAVGGNLEDSTMTLLRGHFAMVVLVRAEGGVGAVEQAVAPLAGSGSLIVDVRALTDDSGRRATVGSRLWVLRVQGADRPGIVAAVTRVVADHGGNIVDLGTRLAGELYVLVAEVEMAEQADLPALQDALRDAGRGLGVRVSMEPVEDELL